MRGRTASSSAVGAVEREPDAAGVLEVELLAQRLHAVQHLAEEALLDAAPA